MSDNDIVYIEPDTDSVWWQSQGKVFMHELMQEFAGKRIKVYYIDIFLLIRAGKNLPGWDWNNPPLTFFDESNEDITKTVILSFKIYHYYNVIIKPIIFVFSALIISYIINNLFLK